MKSCPNTSSQTHGPSWLRRILASQSRKAGLLLFAVSLGVAGSAFIAHAALPSWMQNIESHSIGDNAFFRIMMLPSGPVRMRRPPAESVTALNDAIHSQAGNAELYSLRALANEQKLDADAAEADWKHYLENASDKGAAGLALADFYHRRVRPMDEINTLLAVGKLPVSPAEKLLSPSEQRSWQAFERILTVIDAQMLGKDVSVQIYKTWMDRYPEESSVYGRYFEFLLSQKDYAPAAQLIETYRKAFPSDMAFPVKAQALLKYKQAGVDQGLAVYDQAFQPLWPPDLVKDYFDLLTETRSLPKFLDGAHAALARNPDDLNAVARVFYYYQQQGKLDAAQQTLKEYRLRKEGRNGHWKAEELYTFARLLEDVHAYPEAARYYYALYNSDGSADAQEKALAGIANILLTAPEEPMRLGAGELSLYSDIATLDNGPGFLNGILSLLLNTTTPQQELSQEEKRAEPYFHRSRAAELLVFFDGKFPNSARRSELHAKLIEAYENYGQNDAVIAAGNRFLKDFPKASERTDVALKVASAYARTGKAQQEFAIYDAVLRELAQKAEGIPLGERASGYAAPTRASESTNPEVSAEREDHGQGQGQGEDESEGEVSNPDTGEGNTTKPARQKAFKVNTEATAAAEGPRSPEYQQVLDLYLSRLVTLKQLPQAVAVLRGEIDRNPNDPGLYEHLADFLDQNRLGAEQEAVYQRAIQQFPDKSWYHKLARWYVRYKKRQEFENLTNQVIKSFAGGDLEAYINQERFGFSDLELRINKYAHERFPHNLVFIDNLLGIYMEPQFYDPAAWETLLRQHWFEDASLRNRFFEYLSSHGKLEAELAGLKDVEPALAKGDWTTASNNNPDATLFVAEAELWQSRFEASAPVLAAVAAQYPGDAELGRRTSSVFRSLAAYDGRNTEVAVGIEQNLLKVDPGNLDIMERIGDIYADREMFAEASPYWKRMPATAPGKAASYLEAASVFWDYYHFDDALQMLEQGRGKLNDPALYSYEEGAVYEDKRDYSRAVGEYLKGALAGNDNSRARLLQLANRPSLKPAIDAATRKVAEAPDADLAAINLRVAVLQAGDQKQELVTFLTSILDRTSSLDVLEEIDGIAQEKSLEAVHQRSLERQAAVTTDPLNRLQLRYSLVSFYESKKDLQSAQRNIEALYKENTKILGVVRATADFYWNNGLKPQAIQVLLQAANDSYPDLKARFQFEAARKLTETGGYDQARKLILSLLEQSPYSAEYLAAMADTYARAGDNAGLRDFYLQKIDLFRKATLPDADRKDRIAALRRGLIPALTVLKDYAGGVDQYIEIIKVFPADSALVTEAGFYAQRYDRKEQLLQFFGKATADSPKDSRWPIVLAEIEANFEDYPAAIEAESKAIKIRPDRIDLLTTRAELEERLLRLDDAVADYANVYELDYHNAKWMESVAELRARQGKVDLAVAALKTALIDGRPEIPGKYFEVAKRLEGWSALDPAREYAQKGVNLAGDDLLSDLENHDGVQTYVRIMTRLRQQQVALQTLQAGLRASTVPARLASSDTARQVAGKGIDAVTEADVKNAELERRKETGRSGMAACLRAMGAAADRYFTPEEKVAFAQFVQSKHTGADWTDVRDFWIPLVTAAGLPDQEAKWRYDLLSSYRSGYASDARFEELQRRRLKLGELGAQFEWLADHDPTQYRSYSHYYGRAADVYRLSGDPTSELRMLEKGGSLSERYFQLLLANKPDRLIEIAGSDSSRHYDAANYVIANGDPNLAYRAIAAAGRSQQPVWSRAYTALAGLYFDDSSPQIQNAFLAALGDNTIGERVGKPVDRNEAFAGDIWFEYGSRYGEYLGVTKKEDPEDFLPAILEKTPGRGDAYLVTARYYEDAGDLPRAIADYQHALELKSTRIDAHQRLALIYWKQNDRERALQEWQQVLSILQAQVKSRSLPESFWNDYANTIDSLGTRRLLPQFRPQVNKMLVEYVKNNGEYRAAPLLRDTFRALHEPAGGGAAVAWLLDLSTQAQNRLNFLASMVRSNVIPLRQRGPMYAAILDLAKDAAAKAEGVQKQWAESALQDWQARWLQYLMTTGQVDEAAKYFETIPQEIRAQRESDFVPLQLRIAAAQGSLDTILQAYRSDTEHAPSLGVLRSAAATLQQAGDKKSARKILEMVFSREIEGHELNAANMLGLAEIRIEDGDLASAVPLLHRMTLVVGDPFANQDSAASLLIKTGHPAEAILFLEELVQVTPWDMSARVHLAQAEIAAGKDIEKARDALATIAGGKETPYELRSTAAAALAGSRPGATLGSGELDLLARGQAISTAEADKAFYFAARMQAITGKLENSADAVTLLRAALQDHPYADAARLPFFRAALAQQKYYLAIASVQPLIGPGGHVSIRAPSRNTRRMASDDETSIPEAEEDNSADEEPQAGRPAQNAAVPLRQMAELYEGLGLAYAKIGELQSAVSALQNAYPLEKVAAKKTEVTRQLAEARAVLRRRTANAARQPELHDALEQDRLVHARLLATSTNPAAGAGKGGAR